MVEVGMCVSVLHTHTDTQSHTISNSLHLLAWEVSPGYIWGVYFCDYFYPGDYSWADSSHLFVFMVYLIIVKCLPLALFFFVVRSWEQNSELCIFWKLKGDFEDSVLNVFILS